MKLIRERFILLGLKMNGNISTRFFFSFIYIFYLCSMRVCTILKEKHFNIIKQWNNYQNVFEFTVQFHIKIKIHLKYKIIEVKVCN